MGRSWSGGVFDVPPDYCFVDSTANPERGVVRIAAVLSVFLVQGASV